MKTLMQLRYSTLNFSRVARLVYYDNKDKGNTLGNFGNAELIYPWNTVILLFSFKEATWASWTKK